MASHSTLSLIATSSGYVNIKRWFSQRIIPLFERPTTKCWLPIYKWLSLLELHLRQSPAPSAAIPSQAVALLSWWNSNLYLHCECCGYRCRGVSSVMRCSHLALGYGEHRSQARAWVICESPAQFRGNRHACVLHNCVQLWEKVCSCKEN